MIRANKGPALLPKRPQFTNASQILVGFLHEGVGLSKGLGSGLLEQSDIALQLGPAMPNHVTASQAESRLAISPNQGDVE